MFATEDAVARYAPLIAGVPLQLVTDRAAKALSDTVTPAGLIAVCELPTPILADVLGGDPRLVAVAVDISEPGNAGTLIRIADAMGAAAVVLAGHAWIPTTASACARRPAASSPCRSSAEPDAVAAVTALRAAGLRVLATTVDGEIDLADAELAAPTAWLFGPEAHGLPAEVAALADQRVRIEMPGNAESLNVAAAAAICLYQSARALR